jgi:hypothetical protein
MRLAALDNGHAFRARMLLGFIKLVSRRPPPDVIKLLKYRPDFFGDGFSALSQEVMRGPSPWAVGDRELMAAFVSKMNECEF